MKNPIKLWRMAQASVIRHVRNAKSLLQQRNRLMALIPPKVAEAQALEGMIRDAETRMAQAVLRCKELEAEIRVASLQELQAKRAKDEKDAAEQVENETVKPSETPEQPAPAPTPKPEPETIPPSSKEGKAS